MTVIFNENSTITITAEIPQDVANMIDALAAEDCTPSAELAPKSGLGRGRV